MMDAAIIKTWVAGVLIAAAMLSALAVYNSSASGQIDMLRSELSLNRRLLDVRERQLGSLVENQNIIDQNAGRKLLELEEIVPAMANLSQQMKAAGLTETYFKLERREVSEERDGVFNINRMLIEGVGDYSNAVSYLDELMYGDTYYFIENFNISQEGSWVRLRVVCVIAGFGNLDNMLEELPEIPEEYMYLNPFDK